jgi:hypothetical protein
LDGSITPAATASLEGGELLTKPLIFSGQRLSANFATLAAGSLHVEITDVDGIPLPGFSFADTSSLSGVPVRLRFRLGDAEVYAFQFME